MAAAGVVVVFDFDKTIIDCDSDDWVVTGLGVTDIFDRLRSTMPWNTLMDTIMTEIYSRGVTVKEIAECLKEIPLNTHIIGGIKSAYALGCELRIVSDANRFFIETVLQHHGLTGYFSEINTNPAYVDEDGKLRIAPFFDFHGCPLCPPNMCKGIIIDRIMAEASAEGKEKMIYLGDGKGDYCPTLKLTQADYVMPRKNYPLWELICSDPTLVKAEVHEWSNGEEQEEVLLQLIHECLTSDVAQQLNSKDYNNRLAIPVPSPHEVLLPKALRVPN